MIKKNNITTGLIIFLAALFLPATSMSAITGVSVSADTPTTVSGDPYYLASSSTSYDYVVTVTDPAAATRDYYNYVDLVIPMAGGNTITARWTADAGFGLFVFQAGSWGSSTIAAADGTTVSGTTTLTLTFRITFAWNIPLSHNGTPGLKTITATAYDDALTNMSGSTSITYGFCNQVKVGTFAQGGSAADGMVNPYSAAFNVTGSIYYNIAGTSLALTNADINTVALYRDAVNTAIANTGADPAFIFSVDPAPGDTLGGFDWRISVTLNNPDASTNPLFAANTLPCIYDRVQVTSIVISNPGNAGRINGTTHWRSTLVPGTTITINAEMQLNSTGMNGDTVFRINNGSTNWDVTILSGETGGTFVIPSAAPDMITESGSDTYTITQITNPYYGVQTGNAQIRETVNYPDTQYSDQLVWWDDADAPNGGAALTNGVAPVRSATSVTVYWVPVNTSTASADGDFYEYRVYIRETAGTPPWNQWNGDNDPLLRDSAPGVIVNNPNGSTSPALNFTNPGGQKYTTVTGLDIFTEYEYYVTAVDIFGNEISTGTIDTFRTTPYSIEATVSDGITSISNATFATDNSPAGYGTRQLRDTNISVTLRIVTSAGEDPDSVIVWFTNNPHDGGDIPIIDIGNNTANVTAFTGANILESVNARKTAPNEWVAYLPSESDIIINGNSVRFVVETTKEGTSAFSDWNTSNLNDFNNDNEWSFSIITAPDFTPWPTRMLNNVITNDNPVAYPSYYLTDDAYVTITAYDIKGRPVAVLLDKGFRRAGQNIKEDGWAGTNKNRKKLGVGLYYIRILAKRASDGKVIIDKYSKIVVAK
ncbi:MAG TPA: hypothetical protein PK514_04680 [Spirochaetota bacterium]|nr:hypothetical protein [Spirochaetota bacterium]